MMDKYEENELTEISNLYRCLKAFRLYIFVWLVWFDTNKLFEVDFASASNKGNNSALFAFFYM